MDGGPGRLLANRAAISCRRAVRIHPIGGYFGRRFHAPAGSRVVSTGPAVAKTVWTDADFDAMDWHDNAIHAVALEPVPDHPGRLLLDLDYIVEWVAPEAPATTLSFWICPATLVFDRAWDLTTDIDLRGWSFQLSLDAITRSGPDERGISDWTLSGDNFTIALSARGFTQYLRRPPIHCPGWFLTVGERGGLSFDQRGYTL